MRVESYACALAVCVYTLVSGAAIAGPWTSIDDAPLRSDIELLASVGVVDNIATQWPLPWAGLMDQIDNVGALAGQPSYIIDAAARLRQRGKEQTQTDRMHLSVSLDAATSPAVVRGYDALGRQTFQAQTSVEYLWKTTAIHFNFGARTVGGADRQVFVPDGSYIAQRLGDTVVYAGYMPHWWGPGWISALSLSTNARPIPQVGVSRIGTAPFKSPWLAWIGPWQFEFFVGLLDGPRVNRNTIYDGLRVAIAPLPGLELAVSRTDMMCGSGHVCKPLSGYFDVRNGNAHNDGVNDEGSIDVRYTNSIQGLSFAVYAQLMNEDTSPIFHSGTSHLYGGSIWHPLANGIGRLTLEYTDSVPSTDIFSGPAMHGFSYNNYTYTDGMRYRGRTLGFSLDSDSRLVSLQAAFTDHGDRTYTVTYHRARISDPLNAPAPGIYSWGNTVTTSPVKMNVVQARVTVPLNIRENKLRFDIEGRLQDDQPRPNKGQLATIEAALKIGL